MSTASDKFDVFTGFTPFSTVGSYRAADYWQLEEGAPYELLRGRLIMSPSPTTQHQLILGKLYKIFEAAEIQSDSLCYMAPMDVVFSDDTILQPDLLYIAKDRRHIVKDRVEGPPDLAVEILSPATGRRDKTEKLDLYAKYGVPEYWIIDPATQVFEFLLLDDLTSGSGRYVIQQQPDDHYRSPRLPEIAIDLAAFWAEIERRLPKT
ncbi:MAG: Uma2 family endonuclease [Planctomycetes bacterium]|nr:Uma2 family endonuclease [Planctomycetota bacterium]